MNLKPVKSKSLAQAVVDELMLQIERGYLKPGEELTYEKKYVNKSG